MFNYIYQFYNYFYRIICPENTSDSGHISLWAIVSKVRLEALMWGAGTALGELPPYFMARAARLSGQEPDDEEYAEYLAYVQGNGNQTEMVRNYFDRIFSLFIVFVGTLEVQA
jgi:hypothetical protein